MLALERQATIAEGVAVAHLDTSVRSFQGDVYADGDELRMRRRDVL